MDHRFTLEKYSGKGSRFPCPRCKTEREFTRYVDNKTGQYLDEMVGRCNRETNCGYHFTPREFFALNPGYDLDNKFSNNYRQQPPTPIKKNKFKSDLIQREILIETLRRYDQNNFILYLQSHFNSNEVRKVIRRYLIGTWKDGRTVFWQIDTRGLIRTGKLMAYSRETGKRIKSRPPSWVHAQIKSREESFNLNQCLFGEHLLLSESVKPIGIVESEKTAVVASIFMPRLIWLATGGCGNLNLNRLQRAIKGRRAMLFPDSSKFESWSAKADKAGRMFDLDLKVSDLLERKLSSKQKRDDFDIADFLLGNKIS